MSFNNASALTFWLGLLGLAAALFALQWLRVRHRRVDVVTTMFWKEAIEESRARVLFRKFRHPWAYLLALAIAGLIWLAWADPQGTSSGAERETILLVDGSARMAMGDRFQSTLAMLTRELKGLDSESRRVFWCGGDRRLLLDRGEEALLLASRMRGLQPEASSGSLEEACLEFGDRPVNLVLVGDGTVSDDVRALLSDQVDLKRLAPTDPKPGANDGIRALGMAASLTNYEAVDIYVRAPFVGAKLDDQVYDGEATALGDGEWVFRDVPAAGGRFSVRLAKSDALSLDDEAAIQLPVRERIRVSVSEGTPDPIRRLVEADPALEIVDAQAVVAIGTSGALPSLSWVPAEDPSEAFVIVSEDAEIGDLFSGLGIDQIDATSLAEASGREIRLNVEPGDVRQIRVWEDLLTQDYNLTQSAAFPLFVAKAIRWLAKEDSVDPYVAVGETHPRLLAAGAAYAPPRAGDYEGVHASLTVDPVGSADSVPTVTTLKGSASGSSWMTWLVLAALVLLGLEWVAYQKGRMP